ncbi:MAG: hypothetical protein OXC46_02330 [Thaumarchaeota archaeon]|nr:hypothetical protein [Nitrososphaerota archaeon]
MSAILGTIILLGVAAVAGSAYYFMAVDRADMIHPYIDMSSFDIQRFSDDSDSVLVKMRPHTDNIINVTISGDFDGKVESNGDCVDIVTVPLTNNDGDGVSVGCNGGMVVVESHTRGHAISYEGILYLKDNTPKNQITAHIQNDSTKVIHSIDVKTLV